jgi:LmbE family N-acetylglucosaminyl deacetylase
MDPKNHIVSETQKLIDNRRLEARKCAEILGIEKLYFDYYGDQMFNAIPQLSMNRAIEKVVYKFVPDIVYTHTEHDLNLDHVMVSQSCQVACRGVNKLYAFEITGSQKFFNPSVFVELTLKQHLTKLEGLEAYKSELKEYPHPRSGLAVETLSRLRGITIGVHYAEAFECIKVIK